MKRGVVLCVLLLTAACAILRLSGLRALPVFGDESIHLHWAQLIRERPIANAFISLQDPKPPLHFWLVALFLPLSRDPVFAGRLLSVAAGVVSVPLLFATAHELFRRVDSRAPAAEALAGAALFVVSPFLAFYQRMVLAESLFMLETLLVAWLSLLLASACIDRSAWFGKAIGLGAAMGAALLTRQNLSYALWALPFLAWVALPARGGKNRTLLLASLFVSALVALLIWAPVLLANAGPDLRTRIFYVSLHREPISLAQRARNAVEVFGWFATYLTPPVLAASLAAVSWLLMRKRRAGILLAGWVVLVLGPPLVFASLFFPRYFLGGAIPLLILAGWLAARLLRRFLVRGSSARQKVAGAALAMALAAWPVLDTVRPLTDWKRATLVAIDRWQYVTGWPAGAATQEAARFIIDRARRKTILLLTPEISGNPTDGLWVLLHHHGGITLRGTPDSIDRPLLVESGEAPARLLLRDDFRGIEPARYEEVPRGAEIDLICPNPVFTRHGSFPAETLLERRSPGIRRLARFENPRDPSGREGAEVVVFNLR